MPWEAIYPGGHVGFLSDLFGFGKRDILESLNPLSGMKLLEFAVADDSSEHLRHYFRFKNREAQDEEFIVIYQRADANMLRYARTHWRRPGQEKNFRTLNERSPWSPAISRLIDMGQDLSSKTRATRTHFSLQVSADDLRDPNWVPPSKPPTDVKPESLTTTHAKPKAATTFAAGPSQWQIKQGAAGIDGPRPKDEFSRVYEFSGLPPPDTTAAVRIECTIESAGLRSEANGSYGLSLNRSVRFYFRPFRLPHEAEFVLRVMTVDRSEGGDFDVLASPVDGETAIFAKFGGRNDTATLLRAFMAGKDLTFEILQDSESLVKLPLLNDGTFKQLWDASANRCAEVEMTYEALRYQVGQASQPQVSDFAAEVRKNPQGYAVWMIEQEPGQYGVLLVKLDRDGGMEDAWQLGSPFADRSTQGSYALDVARDLGIKLMDVVKN